MRKEIKAIIDENHARRAEIYGPYDPLTGFGCYGFNDGIRTHISIPDCIIPEMWVPKETLTTGIFFNVVQYGSIRNYIERGMMRNFDQTLHRMVEQSLLQARW